MTKLEQAAQNIINYSESREASLQGWPDWEEKFAALREALAGVNMSPTEQAEQEPVGWYSNKGGFNECGEGKPLYAAPVRTKDLTDDEIAQAVGSPLDEVYLADFRAVIAADREKNK